MTWRAAGWSAARARAGGATAADVTAAGAGETAPVVTTLVTLPPASALGAEHYWPARSGRAGHTYGGARLRLGTSAYVWWTLDGVGQDPAPGGTGHVVALVGGNRSAAQVLTATAAVIDALDGWSCQVVGSQLRCRHATDAVTTGTAWDAAGAGSMLGIRSTVGTNEGGISTVIAQHLPNPGIARPIIAVDVLVGATVDAGDRWRVALWSGESSTDPAGSTLLADLGRIAAPVVNTWMRLYVPAGIDADQALWVSLKSNANITAIRGVLTGNALRGDWPAQNLRADDGGISTDATVAYPATWPGTTSDNGVPFVMGIRLVVARSVGDASHHSSADPAIWGVHVAAAALTSTIDFNSNLACVGVSPAIGGMLLHDLGFAVGTVRGTQPRVGVMTGGVSGVEPVDPDGATLLVDGGRLVGSSTSAWEYVSLAATPWPASTITSWWVKNNDDASGTTIAFAQDPDQASASPEETPMDFPPAAASPGPFGPEYEVFPADSAYNVTDPDVTFVSPFVGEPDDARPRNVPGARLRYYVPGIVCTPA